MTSDAERAYLDRIDELQTVINLQTSHSERLTTRLAAAQSYIQTLMQQMLECHCEPKPAPPELKSGRGALQDQRGQRQDRRGEDQDRRGEAQDRNLP